MGPWFEKRNSTATPPHVPFSMPVGLEGKRRWWLRWSCNWLSASWSRFARGLNSTWRWDSSWVSFAWASCSAVSCCVSNRIPSGRFIQLSSLIILFLKLAIFRYVYIRKKHRHGTGRRQMVNHSRCALLAPGADELHHNLRYSIHMPGMETVAVVRYVAGRVFLGFALVRDERVV